MAFRSRHCRITAGLASMDRPLLVSFVESQLWGFCSWVYRASWLAQGCIPLLRLLPYFYRAVAEFLRVLCFRFRAKSSRWGHPTGSSLSQSSIGTKSLPPPSWCLVRVFAMGSPCRVEVLPDLDRPEDFLRTFPSGWCLAFAMGSPISGQVALFCALDRNEGFFHSSILSCFAMGSPYGSGGWFPTLDCNEAGFG